MSLKDIAAARQISEKLEGKTFPTTAEEVEEFYNKNHDEKGRFAPSSTAISGKFLGTSRRKGFSKSTIGDAVNKIGFLGPTSRFRKQDIKTLSDPQLRKLHAHLETNSRKWGAALTGFSIAVGLIGIGVGVPALGRWGRA